MDSSIDSALAGNNINPARKWNIFSQDVPKPILGFRYETFAGELESLVLPALQTAILEASDELLSLHARAEVIKESINSIDCLNGVLKKSDYTYTPEYYDLKIIDSQLDIIPEGAVCLSFYPQCREYLVEKKCDITMVLIGSNIIETSDRSSLETIKKEAALNNPDDLFYLAAVGSRALDRLIVPSFGFDDLNSRWRMLDDFFLAGSSLSDTSTLIGNGTNYKNVASVGKQVDIIIHQESYFGKNPGEELEMEKSFTYDYLFFEPAIRGLNLLKDGGTVILKLSSYGTRFIADLIYLYKYLFREVILMKPSSSNPISQEYYLVATNYQKDRYLDASIGTKLNNLLTLLWNNFKQAPTSVIRSFVTNLDNIPISLSLRPSLGLLQTNNKVLLPSADITNFIEWLVQMNKQIGFLVLTNIKYTTQALQDSILGFLGGHSPLALDHVSFREALGYHGRMTLYSLPEFETLDEQQQSDIEKLTETGQVGAVSIKLDKIGLDAKPFQLGPSFLLYNLLDILAENIIDSDIFKLTFLLPLGTVVGQSRVSINDIFIKKRDIIFNIKQWFGILYSLGDLQKILQLTDPDQNVKLNAIKQILAFREWSILDIFNVILSEQTPLRQLPLDNIYQQLAYSFGNLNQKYNADKNTYLNPDGSINMAHSSNPANILTRSSFYLTPLKDLRFRIGYCYNGLKHAIMQGENPSVLGEFELVNLLTDNEKAQVLDVQQITDLISQREFAIRLVDHICLPVYFSGAKNQLAVPEMYFRYQPDVELFASATNRHAPIWCSANPEDSKLGSAGNFYDFIRLDNPLFVETSRTITSMMAFPPLNRHILNDTLDNCLRVFKHVMLSVNPNAKKLPFTIIIVYAATSENDEMLMYKLEDQDIDLTLVATQEILEAYDPFNGKNQAIKLKAVTLTTING